MPSFWDILPANYWAATQETLLPSYAPTAREAAAQLSSQRTNKPDAMSMAFELAGGPMLGAAVKPMLQAAKPGIRAYHGSPHDFDKFDLSKIGTGEGAQAYGHGLYFAERPETAKAYRDTLSQIMDKRPREQQVAGDAIERFGSRDKALSTLEDVIKRREAGEVAPWGQYFPYHDEAVLARDLLKTDWQPQPLGRMYEVNINAHPDQFLDWDKPLSGQTPQIHETMKAAGYSSPQVTLPSQYSTVGYTAGRELNKPDEVARLREMGIPGIKYLDQGSRPLSFDPQRVADLEFAVSKHKALGDTAKAAEFEKILAGYPKPTHNYVVFDDKLIDILKKYGIAGMGMIGMGGAASQQSPVLGMDN
jgi:hypothetical protein